MCWNTLDISGTAQKIINEWQQTNKREPYLHELAIMISDIPPQYHMPVLEEMMRIISRSNRNPALDSN